MSQKMAQKEPEKKMPSTAAKATMRLTNEVFSVIQVIAHCALSITAGKVSMAWKSWSFSTGSLT